MSEPHPKILGRRDFLKRTALTAMALTAPPVLPRVWAQPLAKPAPKVSRPESIVKLLYESLSEKQKKVMCFSWDHSDKKRRLLTLVGLPGKVVVDYVTMLERSLGPLRLWVAAYCNDVFGYLPSARVIAEGGYETRGLYVGGIGFFAPEAQDVVVEKVKALAGKAGRPLAK